jgi:hypothetical protein
MVARPAARTCLVSMRMILVGFPVFAATVGFVDGSLHGVGHLVGVEDGAAAPRSTPRS